MNNIQRLAGKTALITGAARGIGLGFAERYIEEGARVAIADINLEAAQKAATNLGDAAIALPIDVSDQTSIEHCVAKAVEAFEGIDILVNNAALFDAAPITDITRESYPATLYKRWRVI